MTFTTNQITKSYKVDDSRSFIVDKQIIYTPEQKDRLSKSIINIVNIYTGEIFITNEYDFAVYNNIQYNLEYFISGIPVWQYNNYLSYIRIYFEQLLNPDKRVKYIPIYNGCEVEHVYV